VIDVVQLTRGMTALAAGRNAEALENLMRMLDPTDPAHHRLNCYWALPGIAEAAAREGRHSDAEAVLRQWDTKALAKPSPILRYGLAYGRALLAGDEETEDLIGIALSTETGLPPFERARLQLALGTWLRRHRRVADARAPLRAARDCFDALGATLWSERARQELRASGEKSRKRLPDLRDQLSPQELQIANMAADGLSNREIGQKLFLSHRTVGSHLYRLFPKLGITSRTELAAALGQPSAAA
jgi:DNA-binding CsgD family transcriptional regulator